MGKKKDAKKDAKKAPKKALKKAAKAAEKAAEKEKQQEKLAEPTVPAMPAEDAAREAAKPASRKKAPGYVPVEGERMKTVSIKMPASLVDAADVAAKAYGPEGVSRSEYIRLAIEKLLNE